MASPVLQAIVLADHIYVDAATGKKIIAGTFNELRVRETPVKYNQITYAFLCLTEIDAPKEIDLRYVDLREREVLVQAEPISIEAESPLDGVEIITQVPPFPIPHAGVFAFEALCEGELLGALRITAREVSP